MRRKKSVPSVTRIVPAKNERFANFARPSATRTSGQNFQSSRDVHEAEVVEREEDSARDEREADDEPGQGVVARAGVS